ncbi:MAG: oxidoreductase [Halovenus sp.]
MSGQALFFTGEQKVSVREIPIPEPGEGEVLVRTERSAISPGTELLVYRDEVPTEMSTDETIDTLDGTFSYPLQYGYATVGRVVAVGESVDDEWLDRRVFAFNPHESHFLAEPEQLVPTTLPPQQALFIPTVETAVNFVMDARPRIGARVAVFGQGPVGLLTTALLSEFPLADLVTADCYEKRRSLSRSLGASKSVPPDEVDEAIDDPDISFELSGDPAALDSAIDLTGYAGQVIVGSWYGEKRVSLDLGGDYHRSHIRIQSSQVSRLDPDHTDRWDKDRRMEYVRSWLSDTDLSALLTHELAIERGAEGYRLLENSPDEAVQVAFRYD